jgi:hypothetical protein
MTDRANGAAGEPVALSAADEQLLRELTERARAGGLKLTGEGGLLGKLTKMVGEGADQSSPGRRGAPTTHRSWCLPGRR